MKKRRPIHGLFSLLILVLALTACGSDDEQQEPAIQTSTSIEVQAPTGNPDNGKTVFLNKGGCGACHIIEGLDGAVGVVGPNLTQIGARADAQAAKAGVANGMEYLRQSILEPNAYVNEECPTGPCVAGTMPQTLKDQLTEEEVNDVIAFLMQQQ